MGAGHDHGVSAASGGTAGAAHRGRLRAALLIACALLVAELAGALLTGSLALLADAGPAVFTTAHFDGYPAVLVQLDLVDGALLEELVVEAWRSRAGKRRLAAFDAEH